MSDEKPKHVSVQTYSKCLDASQGKTVLECPNCGLDNPQLVDGQEISCQCGLTMRRRGEELECVLCSNEEYVRFHDLLDGLEIKDEL